MMLDAFNLIKTAWTAVENWVLQLEVKFGFWSYVFGVVLAMLVVRFIVYPFLKGRVVGSDSVRADFQRGYDSGYSKGKNDWSV